MKISTNDIAAAGRRYVPLPIGNGDLSLMIDYQGSMEQQEYSGGMIPGIRRAGIRYDAPRCRLVPFGHFTAKPADSGEVASWNQTLDTDRAVVESVCHYSSGLTVSSETFCHLTRNIIALRRRVTGAASVRFSLEYHLAAKRMCISGTPEGGLEYCIDGQENYTGKVYLLSAQPACCVKADNNWSLTAEGTEFVFFLAFGDEEAEYARKTGFAALLQEHCQLWREHHKEGGVRIPSQKIQEVYETAQYHLRISSTKHSVPVGLFDTHWSGHYFGFDEFFSFGGIASTGHLATARRIPEFRRFMLDSAIKRSSHYFGKTDGSARFVWQTVETPGIEGAPLGFWIEHIFHMATIALEAFQYYQYSGDDKFLRDTAYPVIRGCAEYYRIQSVYRLPDGQAIIGKCTDLERLGAGRANAFMTTCGVIATFNAAGEVAEKLGLDAELAAEWRQLSALLLKSLPRDQEKYLPYPGCPDKSIAVLAGVFPFRVLPNDDPLMLSAIKDFVNAEGAGNMYPVGKSVCTWYAGWMAIVFARLGYGDRALEILEKAAADTGCFSEIFEIYETGSHPWFTTAEGSFIQAVNELLVQGDQIAPALPATWQNVQFQLQGLGGKVHNVQISGGKIVPGDWEKLNAPAFRTIEEPLPQETACVGGV